MSDQSKPTLEGGCGGKGRPCPCPKPKPKPKPKRSPLVNSAPLKSYIAKNNTDVPIASPPAFARFGRYRLRSNEAIIGLFLRNRYNWAREAPGVTSAVIDIQLRAISMPGTPVKTFAGVDLVTLDGRLFFWNRGAGQFDLDGVYGVYLQNNGPSAVIPERAVEIELLIQTSLLKVRRREYDYDDDNDYDYDNDSSAMMMLSSKNTKRESSEDDAKKKPLMKATKKDDETSELEERLDTERRRHNLAVRAAAAAAVEEKDESKDSDDSSKKSKKSKKAGKTSKKEGCAHDAVRQDCRQAKGIQVCQAKQ